MTTILSDLQPSQLWSWYLTLSLVIFATVRGHVCKMPSVVPGTGGGVVSLSLPEEKDPALDQIASNNLSY